MKVIKAGIEKTKNAFPNIADMVRQEGFRRNSGASRKDRSATARRHSQGAEHLDAPTSSGWAS